MKVKLVLRIRKRLFTFLGYAIRQEGLENLTLIVHIDGKWDGGKQPVT